MMRVKWRVAANTEMTLSKVKTFTFLVVMRANSLATDITHIERGNPCLFTFCLFIARLILSSNTHSVCTAGDNDMRYSQDVHDDPQGPDVTGLVVLLWAQDLRGHVVRSVARSLQSVLQNCLLRKSEVSQLEHGRAVYKLI